MKLVQALDALKEGIVDGVGALPEALKFVDEMQLVSKTDKGVYGALKREMWRETIHYLENFTEESNKEIANQLARTHENVRRESKIKAWEAKAKL